MLVAYKTIPFDYSMSCRLQEHILESQGPFISQQNLDDSSDNRDSISLEVTEKIRSKYESNDQFGLIDGINSLMQLNPNVDMNFLPGFLENNIPEVFYNILNGSNLQLIDLVFALIVKYSQYQEIFGYFLTKDYIQFLVNYLETIDLDQCSYDPFLFLKYILKFSEEQDDIQFLIDNSVIEMICNFIKDLTVKEFIIICLDILVLISATHLENDKVIQIFDVIVFIRNGPISRSSFIEKSFQLFNNFFISNSMIFELFEKHGFLELVQAHVLTNNSYEITTYYACLIISHIYTKFECSTQFQMRKLLRLILDDDSKSPITEKCSMAAAFALSAQLLAKPYLARRLMDEYLFPELFECIQKKSIVSKISVLKVFIALIKESTEENFSQVFDAGQQNSIFDYIYEMSEVNNHSLKLSLKLLLEIFEKSELFDLLDDCRENFLNTFAEKFFEKEALFSDDEETLSNFKSLRDYL